MDSAKRKVIELTSGMRFGVGVGRFTVEKVTKELCQVSYNRKAGSEVESTFYIQPEPLKNLIQIEETERLLKNAEEKARYWRSVNKRNEKFLLDAQNELSICINDFRESKKNELRWLEATNAKGAYIDDLNQRLLGLNKITIEKDDAVKLAKREIRELEDELAAANRRYRHHMFLVAFANVAFFLGFAAYIACFV